MKLDKLCGECLAKCFHAFTSNCGDNMTAKPTSATFFEMFIHW